MPEFLTETRRRLSLCRVLVTLAPVDPTIRADALAGVDAALRLLNDRALEVEAEET